MINKMEISNMASVIRRKLGVDDTSPIDIFTLVQSIDFLTLIFYPLKKNISGACLKNKYTTLIAINSDMSLGRQRFTLAHELYHYYFDDEEATVVCSNTIGAGDESERKADQFASYFLMPSVALYSAVMKCRGDKDDTLSMRDIISLEQYFKVSHQAMLIRLQEEGLGCFDMEFVQNGILGRAARLGYDLSLYKTSEENNKKMVLGHYIHLAEELHDKKIISDGKYEELMLDAFREDIVYGEEYKGGYIID